MSTAVAAAVLAFLALAHAARPPVVFVPGLTESDVAYKLDAFKSSYPWCKNNTSWRLLWPIEKSDVATIEDVYCWFEAFTTFYNTTTKEFQGPPGIDLSTVNFGGFLGIGSGLQIAQNWVKAGWTMGKDLFCAPYDWRFPTAAGAQDAYYEELRKLIETVHASSGQKVYLMAVSFGPQITLGFLHRMTPAWKDQHIAWFIAESPVWSGAPIAVSAVVSGIGDENSSSFNRQIATRVSSLMWLFPQAGTSNTTWGAQEPLIVTPARSYTANDYAALITDLGLGGLLPALGVITPDPDLSNFDAPLVNTLVTFGYGIGTPGLFKYKAPFVANASVVPPLPDTVNSTEAGDCYVPLRSSLRALYDWPAPQRAAGKQLLYQGYPGQIHAYCLFPEGGPCFNDVLSFIVNGTIPHATPARSPSTYAPEHEFLGLLSAARTPAAAYGAGN